MAGRGAGRSCHCGAAAPVTTPHDHPTPGPPATELAVRNHRDHRPPARYHDDNEYINKDDIPDGTQVQPSHLSPNPLPAAQTTPNPTCMPMAIPLASMTTPNTGTHSEPGSTMEAKTADGKTTADIAYFFTKVK
ncbi:hypothetical protein SCLCIDRAFT_9726 [Scleroderma citrinum Foug A]|uniref:Uncharacterized protein n=1 Tax=Scleroderma citrinum Foug A TaxID=1036808 RepID=A0A0C3A6F7_9AGAM|nr:hypothetical protein SCLCIDRAFT_9726 [Scleroderma citrinum Foug A]